MLFQVWGKERVKKQEPECLPAWGSWNVAGDGSKPAASLQKQMELLEQKDSRSPVQSQSSATARRLWPSSRAAQRDLPAWETRAAQDITAGMSTLGPCPRARDSRSCHHPRLRVARATPPRGMASTSGSCGPAEPGGRCHIWHGK